MGSARSARVDKLFYLLSQVVTSNYYQKAIKCKFEFHAVKLTVEEQKMLEKIESVFSYSSVLWALPVDRYLVCREVSKWPFNDYLAARPLAFLNQRLFKTMKEKYAFSLCQIMCCSLISASLKSQVGRYRGQIKVNLNFNSFTLFLNRSISIFIFLNRP